MKSPAAAEVCDDSLFIYIGLFCRSLLTYIGVFGTFLGLFSYISIMAVIFSAAAHCEKRRTKYKMTPMMPNYEKRPAEYISIYRHHGCRFLGAAHCVAEIRESDV